MNDLAQIKHTLEMDRRLLDSDAPNRQALRSMLATSVKHRERLLAEVERLEAEAAAICSRLYAAGIPSASEDGYGENVKRLKALLERLCRTERERDEAREAYDALAGAGEVAAGNVPRRSDDGRR